MLYHTGGNWSVGARAGRLGEVDNTPSTIGARLAMPMLSSVTSKKMIAGEV